MKRLVLTAAICAVEPLRLFFSWATFQVEAVKAALVRRREVLKQEQASESRD